MSSSEFRYHGIFSQVRVQGNVSWAGESEQGQWFCVRYATPLWYRESWNRRQSFQSTIQSLFLPSPMVMKGGSWPKERDHGYKRPKWVFRRVAGVSLMDRVRSLSIWEGLGVQLLLLCVERSQLRWFEHLLWMPPGRIHREVFQARPAGRRPWGRPRTRWRDYISTLAWECLWNPSQS